VTTAIERLHGHVLQSMVSCRPMATVRYRYRLYPTPAQRVALARTFGAVRFVWNQELARSQIPDAKYQGFSAASRRLTAAKKTTDLAWLNAISCVPIQQSLRNLDVSYRNFFRGCKSKGPRRGYPRFKSKYDEQSAEYTRSGFKVEHGKLCLAKLGSIEVRWSRLLPSIPKTATVKLDATGRYFVSFTVEVNAQPLIGGTPVGIDLGIKCFAALSTGEMVQAPSYKRRERKIAHVQRELARRKNGSRRRAVTKKKLARLHAKISDTRRDFLDKLSTRLVRSHDVIVVEDLNVSGMVKNHHLARSISRQGWRAFRTMLESKCTRYGRELQVVNRWTPTSQICSTCGHRWGRLDLSVRQVTCEGCGAAHDRDVNAAKNIVAAGQVETKNGRGGHVRRMVPLGTCAVLDEASTSGPTPESSAF